MYKQMRLSYRLTIDDYYDAGQARNRKNRRVSKVAAVAMVVAISLALIRGLNVQVGHKYLSLGLFLIVFFGIFPASRWIEKLLFRRALKKTGDKSTNEYVVDISENGIRFLDQPQEDDRSHFSKYSESPSSFILYQEDSICAILPKRAFNPEGIDSFREILSAKLPNY